MIEFACPKCGETLRVKEQSAGKSGKCKFCSESITVPSAVPTEMIPAPAPEVILPSRSVVVLKHTLHGLSVAAGAVGAAVSNGIAAMNRPRTIAAVPAAAPPIVDQRNYGDDSEGGSNCPFCDEPIRKAAKKCKHCGEILDIALREVSRPVAAHASITQVTNVHTTVVGSTNHPRWNRLVAFILSFLLPGLGQLYKGQPVNGLIWFLVTVAGYVCFVVPGIVLHLCCMIGAASGDTTR